MFGILYSSFTVRNPGLTADATVMVPGLRPAGISVPSGASITVVTDTTMADGRSRWATVRGGGSYQIAPGTEIAVLTGVSAAAKTCVDAGKLAFLQAGAAAGVPAGAAPAETDVRALTLAVEQAFVRAVAPPLDVPSTERAARAVIEPGSPGSSGGRGYPGRRGYPRHECWPAQNPMPGGKASGGRADPHRCDEASGAGDRQPDPEGRDGVRGRRGYRRPAGQHHLSQRTRRYPPGTWTIQASDVLAQPSGPPPAAAPIPRAARHVRLVQVVPPAPPAPADAPLTQPILIDATGGAKITVTGAADMSLPQGAVISAPRRPDYPLPRPRRLLAPQGTNVIVASLGIILGVNILTMFGIGAELGIAGVLAAFSRASVPGLGFITAALAVVAIVVILYAGTATRAMADPQPGSSISSQARRLVHALVS